MGTLGLYLSMWILLAQFGLSFTYGLGGCSMMKSWKMAQEPC